MGWRDTFAFLEGAIQQNYVGSAPRYQAPRFRSGATGYDPWAVSKPTAPSWPEFASRRLPGAVGAPIAGGLRAQQYRPAAPPERFNVNLFPDRSVVPPPRVSTKGDVLGSLSAAAGETAGHLNPFTAIPWLMERITVGSRELAAATAGNPATAAISGAADIFANTIIAGAEAVAPFMEALPNWYRDTHLRDRAKVFAAIIRGDPESLDTGFFGLSGGLPIIDTQAANQKGAEYKLYARILAESSDPEQRNVAERQTAMLLESMDLPQSVKNQLRRNPNADIDKLLNEAPEGRMFSYDPGLAGFLSNLATPTLFYLATFKGGFSTAQKFRLPPGITYGEIGAAFAGGARAAALAGGAIKVTSQTLTAAARLQKYALASGLGYAGLSMALSTKARFDGDEAAIDWWEKVNRTQVLSDKPAVHLVTGFTVNPLNGLRDLKRGVVRLSSGVGDVTIGRALGTRFTRYYTHSDLMADQIRRMYRLGSREEAEAFIETQLGGRGEAFDQVVGLALQTVIQRLPLAERAVLAAMDDVGRLRTALKLHGPDVMRLLEKEPELLATRWYDDFWLDRQMEGPFNAPVAALIARDYRQAVKRTYELRGRIGAVIGRAEFIPPRGVQVAREWLDERVLADGTVPLTGVGGFQDLQRQLPALAKYKAGLIAPGATTVPRAAIEEMIGRAELDYAGLSRTNPIRATTGTDPILRPNASDREWADALGTTDDVIAEIQKAPAPDAPVNALRGFLTEKMGLDPATVAALSSEEVWTRATRHVDEVTEPWVELGQKVATAERHIGVVRAELARLRGLPRTARDRTYADTVARFEFELATLNDLVRLASDPPVPFSEWVRSGRRETRAAAATAHQEEMALRRAQAIEDLERLDAIESDAVVSLVSDYAAGSKGVSTPWYDFVRPVPGSGVMAWSGGASPMNLAFRRRFADYLRTTTDTGPGQERAGLRRQQAYSLTVEMGDQEAWALFFRYPQAMARMTKTQQRYARAAGRGIGIDEFSNNYRANAAEGGTASDAFLEDLVAVVDQRAELLAGRSRYQIARTAGMRDRDPTHRIVERVAQVTDPRSPTFDPEFAAVTHPQNVRRVAILLERPDLYPGLANVVNSDPVMMDIIARAAFETNTTIDALLSNVENAALVKGLLVPPDWTPPAPGVNPITPLDTLITNADRPAIEAMTEDLITSRANRPEPLSVPLAEARDLARTVSRPSNEWRRKLVADGADMNAGPSDAILLDAGNRIGLDVLSVIAHGVPGRPPVTIGGTLRLLREIENGNADRMGIGLALQAEGQRVAREILTAARNATRREGIPPEAFRKGLDPAMMAADDVELARALGRDGILVYDDADPLGSLQYVIKRRPKAAVVQEWQTVPELSEEFLVGHFEPWQTRLGNHHVRQAWNFVFGEHSNEAIGAQVRQQFIERAAAAGVDPKDAAAVWTRWRDIARASRQSEVRKRRTASGAEVREHMPADNPLYADVRNIPTTKLDTDAHEALGLLDGLIGPAIRIADDVAYRERLAGIDFGTMFRESSSNMRRWLLGAAAGESVQIGRMQLGAAPIPQPLGRALAATYGKVAHGKAATTLYYAWRFAMDIRYWAMNYFEAQILYLGRAGLRRGEIKTGYMGMSERYLRHLDEDFANNTGYATSRSRFARAHQTFLKEQPDRLRGKIRGMQGEDPALMQQAIEEIAARDPQLADLMAHVGDDPQAYLKALDDWHGKMLRTVDDADADAVIDAEIARAVADSPALAEVYGRLAQVNRTHWQDIRGTFYGNPNRSRIERFLNSYLLWWPLSYQIKATKWLARVLFDRAGGLPTNAGGAVILERFAEQHQNLLATDPEYAEWFEKHETLVFVAQMLVPITPDSIGVSLNPILRDLFFGRTKEPWEIGPLYTFNQIVPPLVEEVYADLYPTLGDAPGFDAIYRMTGRQPPTRPPEPFFGP